MEPTFLPEQIEGKRLTLKKHNLDLAQLMYDYIVKDRQRLRRFLPWADKVDSVEFEKNYIEKINKLWNEKKHFDYGLFQKDSARYMGNIGVHGICWEFNSCEIGYWILGDFEGKGYMNEAVGILEETLFAMDFNRIAIRANTYNLKSASLPKSRGYNLDGIMRQDAIEHDEYRDTLIFSKLKAEFNK